MNPPKKLLILTNVDWFLISHRLVLAQAALNAGWDVYVACEDTGKANEIKEIGAEFIDFPFSRSGTNPFSELLVIRRFKKLYKDLQPDVVHHITLKPVAYGSFAAKQTKIKGVVNAISGLGYNFTGERVGLVQKMILKLMTYGFNRENLSVIFQNQDDKNTLKEHQVFDSRNKIHLIKGSGVDLEEYAYQEPRNNEKIKILFPARMLWDKGVKELKEASDYLREKYEDQIQFLLAGLADADNKAGVPVDYLNTWQNGEYVTWLGHQSDMVNLYASSDIVVLPSYREGLPKTLIEACAIGRPIVTTDAIGCKECVDEGINGFKVPVGDGIALAKALEKLILDKDLRHKMGLAGRTKAENEFDVKDVIQKHLDIYESMLS